MCHSQSGHDVDRDDVAQLLQGSFGKRYGNAMADANIVHQNSHFDILGELVDELIIFVSVLRKVHGVDAYLSTRVRLMDIGGQRVKLRRGTGQEEQVELVASELPCIFGAEAI